MFTWSEFFSLKSKNTCQVPDQKYIQRLRFVQKYLTVFICKVAPQHLNTFPSVCSIWLNSKSIFPCFGQEVQIWSWDVFMLVAAKFCRYSWRMSSLCFMIVFNPPVMVCTPRSRPFLHPFLNPHALQPICRTRLTRSQMKSLSRLSFLPLFPRTESFFHLSDPAATHSPHSHFPLLLLLPFFLHYFHLSSSLISSSLLSYSLLISSFSKAPLL